MGSIPQIESVETNNFDTQIAFSRNLGWLTPEEQEHLSEVTIALPGLGGVGGHHLHNFLRLGVRKFHLADFDTFEIPNFNRQMGATCETIGVPKTEAMQTFAKTINPNCEIKLFPDGVTSANQEEFLSGVDLVVDTLDLYAMDIRKSLYTLSHKRNIPMITAGPFGMGTTVMSFNPKGTSFVEYFDLSDPNLTTEDAIVRFLVGITPPAFLGYKSYLIWKEGFNLSEKRLPSLNIGCDAAAAALGSEALKILLKRGNVRWAPCGFYVDFYHQRGGRFHRLRGNKGWWQKMKINMFYKKNQQFISSRADALTS